MLTEKYLKFYHIFSGDAFEKNWKKSNKLLKWVSLKIKISEKGFEHYRI
jgi:hypothetical protein